MHREINELEERLGMLRDAASAVAKSPAPAKAATAPAPVARVRRRRRGGAAAAARPQAPRPARAARPIRKEVKASQQLQGIYLSLIKQLAKEKRPAIQKLCKDQGRQAAIDKMKGMLRK